jgi:hypothetical protein
VLSGTMAHVLYEVVVVSVSKRGSLGVVVDAREGDAEGVGIRAR